MLAAESGGLLMTKSPLCGLSVRNGCARWVGEGCFYSDTKKTASLERAGGRAVWPSHRQKRIVDDKFARKAVFVVVAPI